MSVSNHLLGSLLTILRPFFSSFLSRVWGSLQLAPLLCLGIIFSANFSFGQDPIPTENQCGENTLLITPCYVAGDPTNPLSSSRNDAAVVGFPYSSQSTRAPRPTDPPSSKAIIASAREVGALWGVAHQRSNNLVFGASVLKRHAGYGPLGSGGIYVMEVDEDLGGGRVRQDLSFSLGSLRRVNDNAFIQTAPNNLSNNQSRDLPPEGFIDASDASAFSEVGRASLGDIDISEDENTLWVVNVYDQTLYEIPIENPMTTRPTAAIAHKVPNPQCSGDYRPWALKVKENKVYVGVVCTDASYAFVYVYNILTNNWEQTPLITIDLSYERGNLLIGEAPREPRSANWNAWADTWFEMDPPPPGGAIKEREFGYAQPILSDIEFVSNGNMVLGFLDRGGMQLGNQAVSPDPSTGLALFTGGAAGDLLIACLNDQGNYILERDGSLQCGSANIEGNVPQSPGNGEFFSEDFFEPEENFFFHDEVTLGSVAYLPGADEIVTTAYDPIDINILGQEFDFGTNEDYVSKSGGTIWFSLDNAPEPGKKERGFMVYTVLDALDNPTGIENTFGKAAGLGDLELFCSIQAPVVLCAVDPGTLVLAGDSTIDCYDGVTPVTLTASKETDPVIPDGFRLAYLLSKGEDKVLVDSSSVPEFTVEDFGTFGIHTFIYNPDSVPEITFGVTTNEEIATVFTDSVCGVLDVNGVTYTIEPCFQECVTSTGTIVAKPFSDPKEACFDGINCVELAAEITVDPILDTGYSVIYVLTSGEELTIRGTGPEPTFCVEDSGRFTIHTLVYNPDKLDLSGIVPGQTTGVEVLGLIVENDTCAKLDVTGAIFQIPLCEDETFDCPTDPGSLSPISNSDSTGLCYDEVNCVEIAAEIAVEPILDSGYTVIFVLTSGEELVIQDTHTLPEFCVEGIGRYTIHTLVYDPAKLDLSAIVIDETTGADVLELISISDTCAQLDVEGAPFDIYPCGPCPQDAFPDGGTLVGAPVDCYAGADPVELVAARDKDPSIPNGYLLTYVLTEGEELTLISTGDEPVFSVANKGSYTIHTMVYDPTTLDINSFEPGLTTIPSFLEGLGDSVCIGIDEAGAKFEVDFCTITPCPDSIDIFAGTLSPVGDTCLNVSSGELTLMAEHLEDPVVAEGYTLLYVLTASDDLIISQANSEPVFTITEVGIYRIHTFVYDSTQLDISIVDFGTTTASDLVGALNDTICAALDVNGALFDIAECPNNPCEDVIDIDAGTLSSLTDTCYLPGNEIMVMAEHLTEPVIPTGYESLYLLTRGEGLVVLDTSSTPSFKVQGTGLFTIHTLIFDPNTLNLGVLDFGNITAGMILDVVRDSICIALDATGAPVRIDPCTTEEVCEDVREYTLGTWGADRNATYDHALFLNHSPADPNKERLGDRDYLQYLWNSSGTYREYINEDGSSRDTATITGRVYSDVDPELELEIDFLLVNPMTWDEFQATGGRYKASLFEQEVADTAHVNWTYWEISSESRLIGHKKLDGLVFEVSHFPEHMRYKLQVGYGANDKDGSFGISGWFWYAGEFEGVSYETMGDINVDIDTCIITEVCEPVGGSDRSWTIRNVLASAVDGGDPRVTISWLAFSSDPEETLYAVDKKVDEGLLYETIRVVQAQKDLYKYEVEDTDVEAYSSYSYRLRVVVDGDPMAITKDKQVKLDKILLQLYPNPADRAIQLGAKYPYIGNHRIEVLNAQGRQIDVFETSDMLEPLSIDVSDQSAGMYFLKVTTPDGKVHVLRYAKK